jgi:DNA-binding PadR family transcriptional regulator
MRYGFFDGCDPPRAGRGAGWGGDPGFGWFWKGGGRPRGGFFRGGRVFEQGDLKYVILQLLAEKPRHGYEVMKALEERFGGAYAPSAGTVYPTLSLLEDMGHATVGVEEGGKKTYSITEAGRQYLEEHRSTVDDIFERISDLGAGFLSEAMMEINRAMGRVGKATYSAAPRYFKDRELLDKVREVLDRAAKEIDALVSPKSG